MELLEPYEILLKKADSDLKIVNLMRISKDYEIDFEIYMFHLQQAVEKFLKAILIKNEIEYMRTHDLEILFDKCRTNNIKLDVNEERLIDLTEYSVEGRYNFLSDVEDYDYYGEVLELGKKVKEICFK